MKNDSSETPPAIPAAPVPDREFTPASVRNRADGWTPEKQRAFIACLADTGSVQHAAIRVGMSRESAYRLRRRHDAADFAVAWDAALSAATRCLTESCFHRAIHGVGVPVFYKGEIVGEKRTYSERLAMFLLRYHDPLTYGALSGPKPYKAHKLDIRAPRIRRLPLLLNRLLRRGRTIDAGSDHGV